MVRHWRFCSVAAAATAVSMGVVAAPGVVRAQQATGDAVQTFTPDTNAIDSVTYERGRNVSVLERPRPDYQAAGIQVGGFTIYPKVALSGAYDDNVFAVQSGTQGDFIFRVAPEVDFQSNWSRDSLSGYARVSQDEYARFSSEDATQYGAGLAGKLQFGDSDLTSGVDYGHYVMPRSLSNNLGISTKPIQYDYTAANAQLATEFTRLRLSLRVDDENYDYQNGVTNAGALVNAQFQNHNGLILTGKAELAVSPDAAAYVLAKGNDQIYEFGPPAVAFTQNSSGYEVDGGANFDLTHLLRGEIQLGYLSQTYASPLFNPIDGLSGKAQLEWFPTELTTVTLVASRSVGQAVVVGSAGYLTSDGSLRVDHELLRNLIVSADGWVGRDQYNGINRSDTRSGVDLSADWLITRHVGVTFAYSYAGQASEGVAAGPTFTDNRGTLTLILQP
jgi:hypothetical protein